MDKSCKKIVIKRMVEQHSDFRLNSRLKQACIRDIPKFCSTVIANHKDDEEFEGKVTYLKLSKFIFLYIFYV